MDCAMTGDTASATLRGRSRSLSPMGNALRRVEISVSSFVPRLRMLQPSSYTRRLRKRSTIGADIASRVLALPEPMPHSRAMALVTGTSLEPKRLEITCLAFNAHVQPAPDRPELSFIQETSPELSGT